MELSQIQALAERVREALKEGLNEANTKTSLVLPFLNALGYDVFNHNEVALEYTSEWGTKKGEKVDIAVLRNGEPIILIECKALGEPLDTGKCSQLFRYFTTQSARIGILTDGQKYLLFSDIEKKNIMDDKPFLEIDMLNFNERFLPELQKLTKDSWDIDGVLSSAETLKYVRAIKLLIAKDIAEPSDFLVKYYAKQCFDGIIVSRVLNQFRMVVKRAFAEYISDQFSKRVNSIQVAAEQEAAQSQEVSEKNIQALPHDEGDGIVTHDSEIWAYFIIRTLVSEVIDLSRVFLRDKKTYC